jgi:hypothetical protein
MPWAIVSLLFVFFGAHGKLQHFERLMGTTSYAYVYFSVVSLIFLSFWVMYDEFPRRWIIRCGIVGWIVGFSFLCWFFWFGPGAFRIK